MPVYNFGYGNFVTPFNNGTYTQVYGNGSLSSATAMVNGMLYTQNVMMLGATGNGCGDLPCPQGYSLYFPCLKNIARGEDVCFDFYVVDNATKDTVDLTKVDSLTITLNGNFGCVLGTYFYPSDDGYIRPLQSYDYKTVLKEEFAEREAYTVTLIQTDTGFNEIDEHGVEGNVGVFYSGDTAEFVAFDTDSYIFVGWFDLNSDIDDDCDDIYISTDRRLVLTITSDTNIAAVYRPREVYTVSVDTSNSMFRHYDNGVEKSIYDNFSILEGRHILVRSFPSNCVFLRWDEEGLSGCSHTDVENIMMEIEVTSDIELKIIGMECSDDQPDSSETGVDIFDMNMVGFSFSNLISLCGITPHDDKYPEHEIHDNVTSIRCSDDISGLFESCTPTGYERIGKCYSGKNCLMRMGDNDGNGYIEIDNPGVENMTLVEIFGTNTDGACSVYVELDGEESQVDEIDGDGVKITFKFDNKDFSTMRIGSLGEIFPEEKPGKCLIDKFVVSDARIVDKGKATLCLPGSVTKLFHRGKITATGAIMVGGSAHGLPCTLVGNVTGIPTIEHRLF